MNNSPMIPATPHTEFGNQLFGFRQQRGLSQEKMARELGVSYVTYSRWERGVSYPSKLGRMALALKGLTVDSPVQP